MKRLSQILVLSLLWSAYAFGPFPSTLHPQIYSSSSRWGVSTTVHFMPSSCMNTINNSNLHLSNNKRMDWPSSVRNLSSFSVEITTDRPSKPLIRRIIISGAPASGKGTQCAKIKEKYGVVHLSTGDILRAAVAAQTEVGMIAKEYMDNGRLVPDDIIISLVKERLEEPDCQERGWLLDGFPRTKAQAQALADSGVTADCFLFLNVPDEILIERVIGRRTDPETGRIYHMTFSPPPQDALLRLVHRSDDTEEKVKIRLQQFHANVDAVKDTYTDISVTVNGDQHPDVVTQTIIDAIESRISAILQ